ncbi:aminopeptidase [Roseovarius sp. 22II1-1F6A]|nr:aminopeptidase [Roseovarius sp. 22II1-1F6A]|tara:strand:+ start:931 stop:2001 length:1071 start_codon:yes stop_codon:yes gene_type:complete
MRPALLRNPAHQRHVRRAVTLALSAVGVAIWLFFDWPLPYLLGPLFVCLIAALSGLKLKDMGPVNTGMRSILGVAVGSSITPELVHRLPNMAYSAALVPLFIAVIGLVGYPFFRRVMKFDGPTAFYAAMPGGLQDMVIFGEEAGADIRALSLVHATRVLIIVTFVPFVITHVYGQTLDGAVGAAVADIPVRELLLMAAAALIGWKVAERAGLFGASILGPLIATAVLSLAGFIEHRPPAIAIVFAQFFIGAAIGAKYTGVTWRELRIDVLAGLLFCAILGVIALVFAETATLLGWAPAVEALLSFAPGGQAEMAILTIVAGADLAFVVTHHILRIVVVILGAPIVARVLKWKKDTP